MKTRTSFKPGQSGNPGGRPALLKEVQDLAREHTAAAISTLVRILKSKKVPAQAQVAAASAILDRGYGKPPQSIGDGDGQALVVQIVKFGNGDADPAA